MAAVTQLRTPSIQFKNILCAVDFLPGSLHAFPFAASIASHCDGRLILAYVAPEVEKSKYDSKPQSPRVPTQLDIDTALASMRHILDDVPYEMIFDHGDICSKVLATAKERAVDLIVIGTHGILGMKKLLKGSTAEQIVFLASCPVLTTGPLVDRKPNFERILCVTELSLTSEHAIFYALSFAEMYEASLVFLHVNDGNSNEAPLDARPRTSDFIHKQLQKSDQGAAIEARSQVKVGFGPRTELILEAAINGEADLIVMGLHSEGGFRARITAHIPGLMTYDVIAQAPCPVLTVPLPRAASNL